MTQYGPKRGNRSGRESNRFEDQLGTPRSYPSGIRQILHIAVGRRAWNPMTGAPTQTGGHGSNPSMIPMPRQAPNDSQPEETTCGRASLHNFGVQNRPDMPPSGTHMAVVVKTNGIPFWGFR